MTRVFVPFCTLSEEAVRVWRVYHNLHRPWVKGAIIDTTLVTIVAEKALIGVFGV